MTCIKLSLSDIQAILFDLDGTLRHSRPSYNQVFFDFATQLGVVGSEEQRRNALRWAHYYWASSSELAEDLKTYEDKEALFFTNYLQRQLIAYDCTPERASALAPRIHRFIAETHQPENWMPPDSLETLRVLKNAGFTLGVVSNREEPFHELLVELGLEPYFEFALAAGEVDSWKPDVAIFQHAVQRAGSCPECTVYVGDNYYTDVVGARRAGLQPVLFDPEGVFPDAECPVIRAFAELTACITSSI